MYFLLVVYTREVRMFARKFALLVQIWALRVVVAACDWIAPRVATGQHLSRPGAHICAPRVST